MACDTNMKVPTQPTNFEVNCQYSIKLNENFIIVSRHPQDNADKMKKWQVQLQTGLVSLVAGYMSFRIWSMDRNARSETDRSFTHSKSLTDS